MCNAWNHPIGCRCGWGGEGHLGRNHGAENRVRPFAALARERYQDLLDAHTTPNARCPVCGTRVFFYQSEAGGRVYFDELGPPWPKHSCTDRSAKPSLQKLTAAAPGQWQPLLIESFAKAPTYPHCYAVSGHMTSGHIAFFVRSSRLQLRAPFYIRLETGGGLELSSVQPYMSGFITVTVAAWRSLLDAGQAPVDAWSREEEIELQLFELMGQPAARGEA